MSGRMRKCLAAFTVALTLAALVVLLGPARHATPDVHVHAAVAVPER